MFKPILCFAYLLLSSYSYSQTSIPLIKEGALYKIQCKINGEDLSLFFDTGASAVTLSLKAAQALFKQGKLNLQDIIGKTKLSVADGKIIDGTVVSLREMIVGDIVFHNIEAVIINRQDVPLLFGQSAIEKFGSFTFNYSNNTLTINSTININEIPVDNPIVDYEKKTSTNEQFIEKVRMWKDLTEVKKKIIPYLSFETIRLNETQDGEYTKIIVTSYVKNNTDVDFIVTKQMWTALQIQVDLLLNDGKTISTKNGFAHGIPAHQLATWFSKPITIKNNKVVGYRLRAIDANLGL